MARRALWGYEETMVMLNVMQEIDVVKQLKAKTRRKFEVYEQIKNKMWTLGYTTKDKTQIETRWNSLKKQYRRLKRNNAFDEEEFAFRNEFDRLLEAHPTTSTSFNGVDSSECRRKTKPVTQCLSLTETDGLSEGDLSYSSSSVSSPGRGRKRKRSRGDSHDSSVDKMGKCIKNALESLNNQFLEEQKQLIYYEFQLFKEQEEKWMQMQRESMRLMLKESTDQFLSGLKDTLNKRANGRCSENSMSEFVVEKFESEENSFC